MIEAASRAACPRVDAIQALKDSWASDASSGQQGATRLFAVAAAGHFPPDHGEPLFALELSWDRTADNPVRMLWNGKWLTVAPSFLDFASMASSRTLEYFQTLDPDFARLRQQQEAIAAESYDAWRRRRRWREFWKRTGRLAPNAPTRSAPGCER